MTEKIPKSKDKDANYKYAVLILVGILLVVSVVQAFQIDDVKDDLVTGKVVAGSASTAQSTSSAPQQSAPRMVGGC